MQHSGGLVYRDESGALNEHCADVFGASAPAASRRDAKRAGAPLPDAATYDVRLTEKRGSAAYTVEEPSTDPQVIDVIGDVLHEVVRRGAGRRRRPWLGREPACGTPAVSR